MAKKTLISEGHVRKFMKLAAIGPLTENFLSEEESVEEELTEAEEVEEKEVEMDAPEGDMGMEMGDEEMEMDAPADDGEDAIKAALEQLIGAIKAAPETDIAVDAADEMDEMDELMDEMAKPMEETSCGTMEEDEMYEELNEAVEVVDTQAIVKKVTRRVAERLVKESKQDKLAEVLAAKIAAKLG